MKIKLYFFDNNKINCSEKYLVQNLKTGKQVLETNTKNNLNQEIISKFIENGIYHSELVHTNDKEEKLYFNKENFCKLLHNNHNLLNLSKPGQFTKELNFFINKLDINLKNLSNYFVKSLKKEELITNFIEKYRNNNIQKCKSLSQLLIDYRNFIFNLRIIIYNELLNIWTNFIELKNNLLNKNNHILIDINKFISLKNSYIEFNDDFEAKLNFYDETFKIIDFSDHNKIDNFILDFDSKVSKILNSLCNIKL